MKAKKVLRAVFRVLLYVFAAIGVVFAAVFVGMQFGVFNVRGAIDARNQSITGTTTPTVTPQTAACADGQPACAWDATPEWAVISAGLEKDSSVIDQVSAQTGVSPRMIAAAIIPEQVRFFTSNRDVFKSYFEPLKILGSLSQFSLGISGIKPATAASIETYAGDPTSPFYPGPAMAALIAYPAGVNHDATLYDRLTDTSNHYYQYLYTAIYLREIEAQWQSAGFDVSKNPDVLVTLFNIGFQHSMPKPNPEAGGAVIATGGKNYTYGGLGSDFYGSADLSDVFPQS